MKLYFVIVCPFYRKLIWQSQALPLITQGRERTRNESENFVFFSLATKRRQKMTKLYFTIQGKCHRLFIAIYEPWNIDIV
jgi:hypothetical protein